MVFLNKHSVLYLFSYYTYFLSILLHLNSLGIELCATPLFIWLPVKNMQKWYIILIIIIINWVFFFNMLLTLVDGNKSRLPLQRLSTILVN